MKLLRREYKSVLEKVPILCVDGILTNEKNQVLLVKRKIEPFKKQWWVPGGRVLKGEDLEKAFKRKMREELGIKVLNVVPVGYYEERHQSRSWGVRGGVHAVSVVFAAVPASLDVRLDEQSSEWAFFDGLPKRFRIKPFNGIRFR